VADKRALFEVSAKGYTQTQLEVENAVSHMPTITLRKGAQLNARLLDENGKAVAWARVGVGQIWAQEKSPPNSAPLPFQRNTYTDRAGLFTLNDLDPQGVLVWANHPDFGVVSQKVVPTDGVVDIQIERLRLYSVSGVVALNDGAVDEMEVMAFPVKRPSGAFTPPRDQVDAEGAYLLPDLDPGTYQVSVNIRQEVEYEGRKIFTSRPAQSRMIEVVDRDVIVNFEPLGDARITGVATHNGDPVVGAYVGSFVLGEDPKDRVSAGTATTDKDGHFELKKLPAGKIVISFHKMEQPSAGGKQWSKVDTVDLTGKKELSYLVKLDMQERKSLRVGQKAPNFVAKRLDGSTFNLADYRGKKAVLIDFWATWCPPCVDEIPNIRKIADTYQTEGLEVVGVSLDRDQKALEDFVKEEKLNYVQVFYKEKGQDISKSYGVWGIPSVFLIDKNGVIQATQFRGGATEEAVKKLLAEIKQQSSSD